MTDDEKREALKQIIAILDAMPTIDAVSVTVDIAESLFQRRAEGVGVVCQFLAAANDKTMVIAGSGSYLALLQNVARMVQKHSHESPDTDRIIERGQI